MRRAIFAVVAVIILAPLCFYLGYKLLYPTYTYRYRLSVEVETPDGLRSGSSVIEVRYEMFPEINGRNHISRVFGEAVFVDLGQGKNLVGLLAAGPSGEDVDYPGRIIFPAFNLDGTIQIRQNDCHSFKESAISISIIRVNTKLRNASCRRS